MLNDDIIKIFGTNTDSPATNRGFYYQYLVLLKKWLKNYISGTDVVLYSEVDDDIKQVGNSLIFTQVKCYSRNFSFKSEEIKKTLFNYYILFIRERNTVPIRFCFHTNSGLIPSEKLLKAWRDNPSLDNDELRVAVRNKISAVLNSEIKRRKRKRLEKKGVSNSEKTRIKSASALLQEMMSEELVDSFLGCIKWEFSSEDPGSAITLIWKEIREFFEHEKLKDKPVSVVESVLLSEIYRCSQLPNRADRVLTNQTINDLLKKTNEELLKLQNKELLALIDYKFEEISLRFNALTQQHKNDLSFLNERIDKVEKGNVQRTLAKNLSMIPPLFDEKCHGRKDTITELHKAITNSRVVVISASGGEGKTFLARNYLKDYRSQYNHLIWVNSSPSLLQEFTLNLVIQRSLNLEFEKSWSDFERLQIICSELSKIDGNNLLVIDNYESDPKSLNTIASISGWNVLITTRELIGGVARFKLPRLDYSFAKRIYGDNFAGNLTYDGLEEFFKIVEFNPLVIKLCAKVISNSVDLNLKTLLDYFRKQQLDDNNLNIEVTLVNEDYPIRLLSYLQAKFEYKNLTSDEGHILEFLALLPPNDISIDDLARIGGVDSYNSNLIYFTNTLNSLNRKGWVERTNGTIKVHRLVQELILYNVRSAQNGFVSSVFLIIWLYHRIDETAQNNPSLSFKYLKYAESILKSIKEPFRGSVYQPLLLLENALLNSYNWISNTESLHFRWIDLAKRAENHLADTDINLGIIYNNLGYSYARNYDIDNAINYFKLSIETFSKTETKEELLNSMLNLAQSYLSDGDVENARITIDKSFELSNKKLIKNTQFNAALHYLNGGCLLRENDLLKSSESFKKAITIHHKLDKEIRNDTYLYAYYAELIHSWFLQREHDQLVACYNEFTELQESLEIFDNSILRETYELISIIMKYYAAPDS